ncbi:MAG: hypothetical protein K1X64_11140 [Myxococcaceae bacterium]|nr:hypothetical protein [Myxococcaceae bacterium]
MVCWSCAPRTLSQQLLNAESKANRAEKALDEAEAAYQKFEPGDAEDALEEAKRAIDDADFTYYPEHAAISARYDAVFAKLPQQREAARVHQFEVKAAEHWAEADAALLKLNSVLETVGKELPVEAEVEVAREAALKLKGVLEDGEHLESEVPKYHTYAQKHRLMLAKQLPRVLLDVARLKFLSRVPEKDAAGRENLKRAKKATDLADKKDAHQDAAKAFNQCNERGLALIEDFNPLRTAYLVFPTGRSTAQAYLANCARAAQASEQQVAVLEKAIEKMKMKKPAAKKKKVSFR